MSSPLKLEQQLQQKVFEDSLLEMTPEDLRTAAATLHEALYVQKNHYEEIIGVQWGVIPAPEPSKNPQ